MQKQPSTAATPVRRDLIDPRSSAATRPQTRTTLLNDRRSTR